MKNLKLILNFYRSFIIASTGITLSCVYLLHVLDIRAFASLFWFKIISLAGIFYIVNNYKRKEYFYYRNFGLSKRKIWTPILLFELLFFVIALALTYSYK